MNSISLTDRKRIRKHKRRHCHWVTGVPVPRVEKVVSETGRPSRKRKRESERESKESPKYPLVPKDWRFLVSRKDTGEENWRKKRKKNE